MQSILAARQPESRTVSARPCTISCRFEASEPIPFPGADSIFSSRCGAISGRLRFAARRAPGAAPARRRRHGRPRATRSCAGSGGGARTAWFPGLGRARLPGRVCAGPARSTRPRPRGSRAATGRRIPRQRACGSSGFRPASTHRRGIPRRFSHFVRFQWFAARKISPSLDFRHMTRRGMKATSPQDRRRSARLPGSTGS